MKIDPQPGDNFRPDFIIVGSGAGGGPLAGRLAEQGFQVLVIEAGADHARLPDTGGAGSTPKETEEERKKRLEGLEVSLVPSLHGVSTEHPELSWQFFVDHYDHPPGADPKLTPTEQSARRSSREDLLPAGRGARRLHGSQRHDHHRRSGWRLG